MNKKNIKKALKRTISMLLAFVLVGGVCFNVSSVEVKAETVDLQKNIYAKAGVRYRGHLVSGQYQVYRFTLDRAKKIKFTLNVNGTDTDLYNYEIYNANGKKINDEHIEENNVIGNRTTRFTHYLSKGTYYFIIDASSRKGGNYYWEYSTQALSRITQGVHDSVANAPLMSLGKDYFDHMGINTKKNMIKFNITKPGYYQWYTTVSGEGLTYMTVYNSEGKTISGGSIQHDGNTTGVTGISKKMRLTKGTYYMIYYSPNPNEIYNNITSGILKFRVKPYSYI